MLVDEKASLSILRAEADAELTLSASPPTAAVGQKALALATRGSTVFVFEIGHTIRIKTMVESILNFK